MRHGRRSQRLSRPTEHKEAMVHTLVKCLIEHGQISTTLARAKEAQRLADRMVTLGKEGSIHSRRRAFRVLQNRVLVKDLFTDIAPRFVDIAGGYTRVVRLGAPRLGDGAQQAILAFSRIPAPQPAAPKAAVKSAPAPKAPSAPAAGKKTEQAEAPEKKGLLQGLRTLWTKKKKGSAGS